MLRFTRMDTVLDLDLDFFVWPIAIMRGGKKRLADDEVTRLATHDEVRTFLEQRCHLSRATRLPGREFVEHRDAFRTWRRWLAEGRLTSPFRVFHVDAHADLGLGDAGWLYLTTEQLARPVPKRSRPRFGRTGVTSGNYLAFAIANQWIHSLTYVYPEDPDPAPPPEVDSLYDRLRRLRGVGCDDDEDKCPVEDLMVMYFRDEDWKTKVLELKQYPKDIDVFRTQRPEPIHIEPSVEFDLVAGSTFEFSGFTHLVVAQSPQFTPVAADALLDVIREYFDPD